MPSAGDDGLHKWSVQETEVLSVVPKAFTNWFIQVREKVQIVQGIRKRGM